MNRLYIHIIMTGLGRMVACFLLAGMTPLGWA